MKRKLWSEWWNLLGCNGWMQKHNDEYGSKYKAYTTKLLGCEYDVKCWAYVSDEDTVELGITDDMGVAWIECDLSTYTIRKYLGEEDADEIVAAIDHAESNLLAIGMPFTAGHRFIGKNKANKARRNAALRRKFGLDKKE